MRWLFLCIAAGLVGCSGTVGPDDRCGDEPAPGRAPLRRLTVVEYDNTVRDIFGDATRPAERLIDPERGALNADARNITPLIAEQYLAAAEDIAGRAVEGLEGLLQWDRTTTGDAACAGQLVDRLGPRLFRRPLTAVERTELLALHGAVAAELGFEDGVRAVLEVLLQSPQFLYRLELTTGDSIARLDGYQIATRLSYFLWNTTPDPELLRAAGAGELDSDAGVELHTRRMLEHPRSERATRRFFETWLELESVEGAVKDEQIFPDFNARIAELMRRETEEFVGAVMVDNGGDWRTLVSAPWTMLNDELAAYYGVPLPGTDEFVRVDVDPAFHAGVLTQGAVLVSRDRPYETSPVHRGMFLRANLVCGDVPDVPEGLDVTPPDPDPSKTTRERLTEHRADPVCASCHDQIDPLGFTLEHFDGAGRFRATENGLPIDASGFVADSDFEGSVNGAVELAQGLMGSNEAHACFVKQWFRYAHARGEQDTDQCTIDRLTRQFRDSEFDIRELMVAVTLSDAFLYIDPTAQEARP